MAQQYPSSYKNCATCAYWGGFRKADSFGQKVDVDSANARGKCMCRLGGWNNQDKQANESCGQYSKWTVLR